MKNIKNYVAMKIFISTSLSASSEKFGEMGWVGIGSSSAIEKGLRLEII
jgi:hypothetical protein